MLRPSERGEAMRRITDFFDRPEIKMAVGQSVTWIAAVLRDSVSSERAKSSLDTFVDADKIDRVFGLRADSF